MSNIGEVVNIQINIVGAISDEDELYEVLDIAKVFVIEERMIDLTDHPKTKDIVRKICSEPSKKSNLCRSSIGRHVQFLTVRGLN